MKPSAIGRYIASLQAQPLNFAWLEQRTLPDASQLQRLTLCSQLWPHSITEPQPWQHHVDVLSPAQGRPGPTLLLANNRSPYADAEDASTQDEVDFNAESLAQLVAQTGCTVISVAQIPNQPLRWPGHSQPLVEDDLVAASWVAFMDHGDRDLTLPLQVPMTAALIRALDLWQQVLGGRGEVLVAGLSKRAGAAWLAVLNDSRIGALVAMGFDIHSQAILGHIEHVYRGQWPAALTPYVQAGITRRYRSEAFSRLMQLIDPYAQRHRPWGQRLQIPKLVINASGDDFFPPDGPALYLPGLPPPLGLHTIPNCDHAGLRRYVSRELVPFVRRLQAGRPLPGLSQPPAPGQPRQACEAAVSRIWWQAHNPQARDFRYSQGIRYHPTPLTGPGEAWPTWPAAAGWYAGYLEHRYADGLALNSPVCIIQRP